MWQQFDALFIFTIMPQTPDSAGTVQLFSHPTFGNIRTMGAADNPLFCLKDLCEILGLTPSKAVQRLEKDVLSKYPLETAGGTQLFNFVNEDGLYDVILDSRKPEARQFRKWITSDVLPAIRKTGGYIHTDEQDTEADIMARALMIAQNTIEHKKAQIQALQRDNQILSVKAQYAEDILQAPETHTFTEVAKELAFTSAQAFARRLMQERILFRQSGRYLPYSKYSQMGIFSTRTHRYFRADGSPASSVQTVITEKGRQYFYELFK